MAAHGLSRVRRLNGPEPGHHLAAQRFWGNRVFFAGAFHDLREHDSHLVFIGTVRAAGDVFTNICGVFAAEFVVQVLFEFAACSLASTVGHDASPFDATV